MKVSTIARLITKLALWAILGSMILLIVSALIGLGPIGWALLGGAAWFAYAFVKKGGLVNA